MLQDSEYGIDLLVTTVNQDFNRVSMHGLRNELLEQQAKSIGLPLLKIPFAANVTMDDYSKTMKLAMTSLLDQNYKHGMFGDIFLEDLKIV